MKLHIPGIPHTRTEPGFSHCAYTQKVLKFIPMMRAQGFDVIHYGVGTVNPGATRHYALLGAHVQEHLLGFQHGADPQRFVGGDTGSTIAHVDSEHYRLFNSHLKLALADAVEPGDIVCLPFGHAHQRALGSHPGVNVETGIGYPTCIADYRIYESYAWMAYQGGLEKADGHDYRWVIPNYFDPADWHVGTGPRRYLAYFGRLVTHKGLNIVRAIAEARPDLDVILCGQGDPTPWLDAQVPNLYYEAPKTGTARADFLAGAIALLAPSRYVEPFCGVTVEANFCGTPALTSDFGAFAETITPGANGYRCRTLGDWLDAIGRCEAGEVDSAQDIALRAESLYSFRAIGPKYARVFQQIADVVSGERLGWYSRRSGLPPFPFETSGADR